MKTDFSILWVDDNREFVESLTGPLTTWMAEHGFALVVCAHKGELGIEADLKTKEIELIVLDYKLRGSKRGDEIIRDIRAKNYYHDIVFYSGGPIPGEVFAAPLDGVFVAEKNDAKEIIKALISLRLRRASDLATFRGWFVADSIELESRVVQLLKKCHDTWPDLFKERAMAVLTEEGAFFFGRLREFFAEVLKGHLHDLTFSGEGAFDFGGKHKILSGIIKDQMALLAKEKPPRKQLQSLQSCKTTLDLFPAEIIAVRNALAHQVAEESGSGHKKVRTRTRAGHEIVFTHEECCNIRKNLRKHLENLRALGDLIGGASGVGPR